MICESGHVYTEKVVLVGKTAARVSFEFEIAERLEHKFVLLSILNLDAGGIEWFGHIASDLWHHL